MPRTAIGFKQAEKSSLEAIQASSKTYNRCTALLAEAVGIGPSTGLGPRGDFEMTVLRVRQKLEADVMHPLTEDDFAPNQILQFMRRTAERLAAAGEEAITRDKFVREVISELRERGGLKVKAIHSKASTGHYAWVWSYMQTFLVRNRDVITRHGPTELKLPKEAARASKGRAAPPANVVPKDFAWPPRSTLRFYRGSELFLASKDRALDFGDTLMAPRGASKRKVTLGISTQSTKADWHTWNDRSLRLIEGLIRHDLTHDGYRVRIKRVSPLGLRCHQEFRWDLTIEEI